ncbi:hypothetical protein CR105_27235 [Massilia eurypsychrophila]|uniref:HTH merR-type domain-containing protein n=1 Tax=Massilia eurypsychrophila TaxID=1485217 RepID=A0A2G8T771_9BURK|nr:MerR family transcriptional regulator [Massilia eurypsychrophila]PIL41900.1 hypothetical protein CR105_27235 [Massilia eurypsychrophila]
MLNRYTVVNLRIWERRYGYPNPSRSPNGERQYSMAHLVQLELITDLLALGYRPGKVVGLKMDELLLLRGNYDPKVAPSPRDQLVLIQICVDLIKRKSGAKLKSSLNQELLNAGLSNFVINVAAPLTRIVRVGRTSGRFTVVEEYFFNALLESLMRGAIVFAAQNFTTREEARPRVLLASSGEHRSNLELLLIEALFVLEGAHCTSISAVTSLKQVTTIAKSWDFDIVVVSFSHKKSPRSAIKNIGQLLSELGGKLQVSVDASCVGLVGRSLGWGCLLGLDSIANSVTSWLRALLRFG